MSDDEQQERLVRLHKLLQEHFDLEELRTLCFNLGISYDDLPGEGKTGKARELVSYLDRRNAIPQLITTGQRLRPDVPWIPGTAREALPPKWSLPTELLFRSPRFPFNEPYYALPEREREVESVLETLHHPRQRPVVMVSGLGGMGKTALAVEVARRCVQSAEQPFQAILWESAKQKLFVDGAVTILRDAVIDFAELVNSLGRQLCGPGFSRQSEQDKPASLATALQAKPCLVLVDNLETMPNAQEIVPRLQGMLGERSRVLVTSREAQNAEAYFPIRLLGLTEASSVEFLREEGKHRNIEAVANANMDRLKDIHRVTQGIPLALKLAVGLIMRSGLKTALRDLEAGQQDLYDFIYQEIWQKLSTTARHILRYMATAASTVSREELEIACVGVDLDSAEQELIQASLLIRTLSPDDLEWHYKLHQLTRYYVVNKLRNAS